MTCCDMPTRHICCDMPTRHIGHCETCGKPMRPKSTRVEHWPGTIQVGSLVASECGPCRAERLAGQRFRCRRCQRSRRPEASDGLCGDCRRDDRNDGIWPESEVELTGGTWLPNGRGTMEWVQG